MANLKESAERTNKRALICVPNHDDDDLSTYIHSYARGSALCARHGFEPVRPEHECPWSSLEEYNRAYEAGETNIIDFRLVYLGELIRTMATVVAVYFGTGWEEDKACCIAHRAAQEYNCICIYEKVNNDGSMYLNLVARMSAEAVASLVDRIQEQLNNLKKSDKAFADCIKDHEDSVNMLKDDEYD